MFHMVILTSSERSTFITTSFQRWRGTTKPGRRWTRSYCKSGLLHYRLTDWCHILCWHMKMAYLARYPYILYGIHGNLEQSARARWNTDKTKTVNWRTQIERVDYENSQLKNRTAVAKEKVEVLIWEGSCAERRETFIQYALDWVC